MKTSSARGAPLREAPLVTYRNKPTVGAAEDQARQKKKYTEQ